MAADGPRADEIEDERKCDDVRNYIKQNIDWECEVSYLFREKNLGCGLAVSEAISWFFENVEEGIILTGNCRHGRGFQHTKKIVDRSDRIAGIGKGNTADGKLTSIDRWIV